MFKPLKVKYREEADDFRRENGLKSITLVTFSRVLMPAFNAAMTEESMKSGFRKAGLYPWNADAVDYSRCRAAVKQSEYPDPIVGVVHQGSYDFDTLIVYT